MTCTSYGCNHEATALVSWGTYYTNGSQAVYCQACTASLAADADTVVTPLDA